MKTFSQYLAENNFDSSDEDMQYYHQNSTGLPHPGNSTEFIPLITIIHKKKKNYVKQKKL